MGVPAPGAPMLPTPYATALLLLLTSWWRSRLQGPSITYDCSERPHWSKQKKWSLFAAGQKKRWGSYESYLSFTPEEKARVVRYGSVKGVRAAGYLLDLKAHGQSVWQANMIIHTCRHVDSWLQHPIRLGARSATCSLGWQSQILKLILTYFNFSRNLAPPKITHHTVSTIAISCVLLLKNNFSQIIFLYQPWFVSVINYMQIYGSHLPFAVTYPLVYLWV